MSEYLIFRCLVNASAIHIGKIPGRHMRSGAVVLMLSEQYGDLEEVRAQIGRVDSIYFDSPDSGCPFWAEMSLHCASHEERRLQVLRSAELRLDEVRHRLDRLRLLDGKEHERIARATERGAGELPSIEVAKSRLVGRGDRMRNLENSENQLELHLRNLRAET